MFFNVSDLSSEDVMILVRDYGVVDVPPDGTHIVRIDAVSEFL